MFGADYKEVESPDGIDSDADQAFAEAGLDLGDDDIEAAPGKLLDDGDDAEVPEDSPNARLRNAIRRRPQREDPGPPPSGGTVFVQPKPSFPEVKVTATSNVDQYRVQQAPPRRANDNDPVTRDVLDRFFSQFG